MNKRIIKYYTNKRLTQSIIKDDHENIFKKPEHYLTYRLLQPHDHGRSGTFINFLDSTNFNVQLLINNHVLGPISI